MISVVRSHLRLAAVLTWAAIMVSLRLSGKLLHPFSRSLEQRFRQWVFCTASRVILAITGIRVEVRGSPPKAPFFLVANHLTFMDVFLLASQLGCVFVSKNDVLRWPVFGYVIREMNTIFINRENLRDTVRVNQEIADAMMRGYGVAVFAESKVSTNGVVLPFKPALLEPAARMELPVYYATIHYATPEGCRPASETVVWKEGVGLFRHYLNLASLPRIQARLTFGTSPISGADRKKLAEDLHRAVSEQFTGL